MTHEPDCHEEHGIIMNQLKKVERDLVFHVDETHALLMSKHDIEASDKVLEDEIELLAAAVLGSKRSEFLGGGRNETEGIQWLAKQNHLSLKRLESQAANGGFRSKLNKPQAAAIYVAAITALASVVVAVINAGAHP